MAKTLAQVGEAVVVADHQQVQRDLRAHRLGGVAGSLALANAEFLSALIISQLKNKGTPLIYGGSTGPLDMRTGVSIYSGPECWLNNIAVKELANFYHLPDFNTAAAA